MDVCWWRARFALLLSSVIKGTRKRVRKKSTYGTNKGRVLSHGGSGKCEIQHGSTFKTSTAFKQHGVSTRFVSTESLEVALAIVLPLLLILAGDVELNPGPTQKDPPKLADLLADLKGVRHEWFNFGLHLGMDMADLKSIEHQHHIDLSRCQAEMFELWLNSALNPSWKDVILALRKTDNTKLATAIRFKYLSKDASTPDPYMLPDGISLHERPPWDHSISSPGMPSTPDLGAIAFASKTGTDSSERQVEADSHSAFSEPQEEPDEGDCSSSSTVPTTRVSANAASEKVMSASAPEPSKVSSAFPHLEPSKVRCAIPHPETKDEASHVSLDFGSGEAPTYSPALTSSEPTPVVEVNRNIEGILCDLRMKFNRMFQEVEKSMKARQEHDHLENLKQTVTDITEDDAFEGCKDYQAFFKILHLHVEMFDPHILSSLTDTYGDEDAKSHTERYVDYLEKFKENTAIQELKEALRLARKGCVKGKNMLHVNMKLPKKWRNKSLSDLFSLANDVFGVKSKVLQGPIEIEDGCLHITWCFPERFVQSLREAAIKRVEVLRREELILLRIGRVTVFQDGQLVQGTCRMPPAVGASQIEGADGSKQQQPLSPDGDRMLRQCNDIVLMHISHHITKWEPLVQFFSLEEADREDLRKGGIPNHRLLWLWKKKEKEAATYRLLHQILSRAGSLELAKMVEEIVTGGSWQSPDFAWEAFRHYLKDCYTTSSLPHSGPSNVPDMPYIDCQLPLLLGDEGQERIEQVELGKLFQRSETSAKLQRVLIEGVPGSGKTVLVWRACQQWAKQKLFQDFEVMIYISLADAHVWTAECFGSLIPHPSAEVRQAVAEGISYRSGKGCCIILDGWGDIPSRSRGASVLLSCLEGSAEGVVFPHGSILITMRPMDWDRSPYHIASSVVQLKGLTGENVEQFVLEYFDECKCSPQSLLTALHEQPEALALCRLPVNLANVAFMYSRGPCEFPSSQTVLFKRLINTHMLKNLCQQHGQLLLWRPFELSDEDKKFYDAICLLGYEGVSDSKHTFSASELQARGLDVKKLMEFGPLRAKQQLTWSGIENRYGFVHSTIQHFFCALYMMQQMGKVQQKNTLERIMSDCPTAPVAAFFSGLTQLRNDGAFVALQHGFTKSVPRSPMFRIARHSSWLLLNLIRCVCEADRMDMCRIIGPPPLFLSFSQLPLSSYDCAVLGRFIASYCMNRKCVANFEYCRMTEEELLLLLQPLVDAVAGRQLRQNTLGLNLDYNEVTLRVLECLKVVCLSSAVMELSVTRISKHANTIHSLQALHEGLALCSSEPRISLSDCGFTVDHLPYIIPLVSQARLRLLDLSYSQFSGGLMPLFQAIGANTSLTMLLLMGVGIDDNDLINLAYILQHNSTLTSLALQRNDFLSSTFYLFLQIICDQGSSRSAVNDLHADQIHIDSLPDSFDPPVLIRDCIPVWW